MYTFQMPIPRIPSKAHLIVSESQKGIKRENNGENENSSQGTSQESEDVQFKLEERSDTQQVYDKHVGEIQMKKETESRTLEMERSDTSQENTS